MSIATKSFLVALALSVLSPAAARASSHREAPLIAEDPAADSTDFYMFRSPDAPTTVTIVANYWPLEEPGGGPNFPRLSDNVLYEIKIDNSGDAVEDITYQFRFKTTYSAGSMSFLYNKGPIASPTDANLLVQQTYTVTRIDKNGKTTSGPFPTAPIYVGSTAPTTAATYASDAAYDAVAAMAVKTLTTSGGGQVFVGPRDDPFFVDLGDIFNLLNIKGTLATATGGVDYVAGYNVHAIAIQIPISALTAGGSGTPAHGAGSVIGAWTTASRPKLTVLRPARGAQESHGQWVQVSRLAIPLVNEVVVPVGVKDFYSRTQPKDDATNAAALLKDPELARLFGSLYPTFGPYPAAGRTDLINLISFNLGAAPFDVAGLQPADILRLDVSVAAATDTNTGNRLGAVGGDASGFPNGRRLLDDVVDVMERAVAGALCTMGTTCTIAANTNGFGDNVSQNDATFMTAFPYLARPWSGSTGAPLHKQD